MTPPFVGTDEAAVALATAFWSRMGDLPDPGWQVFLGPPEQAGPQQVILTDVVGCPLRRSALLAYALRRNIGWIDIALTDGSGQILSTGRIGRRRSVARTIAAARMVAGPLAVAALRRDPTPAAPAASASAGRMLLAGIAGGAWFAHRLSRASVTYREWACASITPPQPDHASLRLASAWQTGDSAFWADPFVLRHDDRTWLFMEELDRRTGLGHIIAAEYAAGSLRDPRVVLASDHHLSFPQITRGQGKWLATVETCARHNPVYEFDAIGAPWRPSSDLPALPPHTADPVLDLERGLLVGTDAATDPDSVLIHYRLQDGAWHPDPQTVHVDIQWSRGGGTLDRQRGVRAVQDCSGTYGAALGWTDSEDPSRHLASWGAGDLTDSPTRWSGIHTMTWDPDRSAVWIDAWRRRFSPRGAWYRTRELSHVMSCQG